jgi:hypothetical protein
MDFSEAVEDQIKSYSNLLMAFLEAAGGTERRRESSVPSVGRMHFKA